MRSITFLRQELCHNPNGDRIWNDVISNETKKSDEDVFLLGHNWNDRLKSMIQKEKHIYKNLSQVHEIEKTDERESQSTNNHFFDQFESRLYGQMTIPWNQRWWSEELISRMYLEQKGSSSWRKKIRWFVSTVQSNVSKSDEHILTISRN